MVFAYLMLSHFVRCCMWTEIKNTLDNRTFILYNGNIKHKFGF